MVCECVVVGFKEEAAKWSKYGSTFEGSAGFLLPRCTFLTGAMVNMNRSDSLDIMMNLIT